jgi:excisionase family DNA binding protein
MPLKLGDLVFYTVDEAAKVFDVARQTLWRAIRLGNLPSIRYAHRVFIKKEDILEWKEKHYRADQAKKRRKVKSRSETIAV